MKKHVDHSTCKADAKARRRILLVQLCRNGDCLNATIIARQIKKDDPDCHLTWAVFSMYRSMIEGNPDVDAIWEVPVFSIEDQDSACYAFEKEAEARKELGEFDEVIYTQTWPINFQHCDGTPRVPMFRSYGKKITVPLQPRLTLTEAEKKRVRNFAEKHNLGSFRNVILFECISRSGNSSVNPDYAMRTAILLLDRLPDCRIILSSDVKVHPADPSIIDGSVLTLRENAALTHYCSLLVGCSSGITVVSISDASKPIPMIQVLSGVSSFYASVVHEYEYWGLPTDTIIEMMDASPDRLAACIESVCSEDFLAAHAKFHEKIPVRFGFYIDVMTAHVRRTKQYIKAAQSVLHATERFGWQQDMVNFAVREVFPRLSADFRSLEKKERTIAEQFRSVLETEIKNYPEAAFTLGEGIYPDEGGFRWVSSEGHLIISRLALSGTTDISFKLTCSTSEFYRHFPFAVEIYSNEHFINRLIFDHSEKSEIAHLRTTSKSDLHIRISCSQVFVPSSLGISNDTRELAVRMSEWKLCSLNTEQNDQANA